MLKCGTLNPKTKNIEYTDVGTPQGNVVSPVLANIVLDKLDKFIEQYKIKFEKGKKRKLNKEYIKLRNRRSYTKDLEERKRI